MQNFTHNIEVVPLTVDQAITSWPITSQLIELALDHTDQYEIQDILHQIREEHMVLWLVGEEEQLHAAFTTKICSYPQGDEMLIAQIGGKGIHRWAEKVMEVVEQHAKDNDCYAVTTCGRKGTERLYPRWGFKFDSVIMKKKVI